MGNEEKILELLVGLTETVSKLSKGQEEMRSDIAELKTTQAKQGEQIAAVQATLAEHGAMLKEHSAALGRLEEKVDELDARSLKSAVLLETDIPHQLGVLFEGHKNILDTLATKERVEKVEKVVEERVVVLEAVVKSHSQKIAKLEKAQ